MPTMEGHLWSCSPSAFRRVVGYPHQDLPQPTTRGRPTLLRTTLVSNPIMMHNQAVRTLLYGLQTRVETTRNPTERVPACTQDAPRRPHGATQVSRDSQETPRGLWPTTQTCGGLGRRTLDTLHAVQFEGLATSLQVQYNFGCMYLLPWLYILHDLPVHLLKIVIYCIFSHLV